MSKKKLDNLSVNEYKDISFGKYLTIELQIHL